MTARRRLVLVATGVVVGTLLSAGAGRVVWLLQVAAGYKAKMVCSGVFVSGRDPEAVLAELPIDDLEFIKHLRTTIDKAAGTVDASVFGLLRRRAHYRPGLGCALALDGLTPPSRPVVSGQARAKGNGGPPPSPLPTESQADDALAAVVRRAFVESIETRRRRTLAVVVLHHGRLAVEQYRPGTFADTPLAGWSMSKSALNALVGILVGQGRLALDGPVPAPEWREPGDPRASITLDHLLRMSSGLRFDEGANGVRSDVVRMLFGAGDAAGFAARQPLLALPGTRWSYSSGTSNIVSRLVRDTIGHDEEYYAFARERLFDRIGMSSAVLETDAAGTFIASSYMHATARDWARLGQLYLQDGVWDGARVLPEGWVAYSTRPTDPGGRYGAHFWLQVSAEYCASGNDLPPGTFHATGHEGQFVTIVPSRDAVIVRLGRTRYPEAWDHCAFAREVIAALDHSPQVRGSSNFSPFPVLVHQ